MQENIPEINELLLSFSKQFFLILQWWLQMEYILSFAVANIR